MRKRAIYQVITEMKSSPAGVDWLMIVAARKAIQRREYLWEEISEAPVPDRRERRLAYIH